LTIRFSGEKQLGCPRRGGEDGIEKEDRSGIGQRRIAGINLAVDPPDVFIQPRLGEMKMLEFDRVEQAIEEGYIAVKEKIEDIRMRMENP